MVWGGCQRRGARILTITVGHIQSYIHKEMRAEREKIFFTSILLSCSWAWAIVTLTMESLHTEPFYHLIKLTGFLLTLTDMHEEIIWVAEGRIKSVWGCELSHSDQIIIPSGRDPGLRSCRGLCLQPAQSSSLPPGFQPSQMQGRHRLQDRKNMRKMKNQWLSSKWVTLAWQDDTNSVVNVRKTINECMCVTCRYHQECVPWNERVNGG